jgi:hypothetical protein
LLFLFFCFFFPSFFSFPKERVFVERARQPLVPDLTLDLTNCAQLVESHTIHEKEKKRNKRRKKAHRQSIHLDQIKGEKEKEETAGACLTYLKDDDGAGEDAQRGQRRLVVVQITSFARQMLVERRHLKLFHNLKEEEEEMSQPESVTKINADG